MRQADNLKVLAPQRLGPQSLRRWLPSPPEDELMAEGPAQRAVLLKATCTPP